jgi:hypothetical protein
MRGTMPAYGLDWQAAGTSGDGSRFRPFVKGGFDATLDFDCDVDGPVRRGRGGE